MKYIITENQLLRLRLKRNIDKLPKYIRSVYRWLNPGAFENFEEFLHRVIFSTTRDFVAEFKDKNEDFYILMAETEPIIRDIIMSEYYDEILNYFDNDK